MALRLKRFRGTSAILLCVLTALLTEIWRFNEMRPNISRGYATSVCIMVTPDSLESILNSPLPSSALQREREELPFVVAVSRAANEIPIMENTEDDYKPQAYFRVAVEALMDDLYGIMALDVMDLPILTNGMRQKDIWCHLYKDGIRRYEETRCSARHI